MKTPVFTLFTSVLFLAACSSESDNSSLDVRAKPANPASQSYVSDIMQTLKESEAYLPKEETLFDVVMDDSKVKGVSSSEKTEALKKLNSTGRQFVDKVKETCTLTDAKASETGEVAQGKTKAVKLSMSASGKNCVYEMEKNATQSIFYSRLEKEGLITTRGNLSVEQSTYQRIKIRDERIRAASKLSEIVFQVNLKTNGDFTTSSSRYRGTLSGEISLNFSNTEVIRGPLEGYFNGTIDGNNKKTDFVARFKGTSAHGDIWFAIQTRNEKSEIYLNGEKITVDSEGNIATAVSAAIKAQLLK